ncbi:MAG TPA: phage tail sheath C-terminal domain-containing protein [Aggregatilineaceae bacterium]|nr:phage tail sheath C-terminal domain-containing protein [Aggregatilineaceae bacterium]
MPEYLAPGVYVEEVDTGSKPIEGVSTSTTGMIGVTERGPVNVPVLVTSYGEFVRWFGDKLNIQDYSNGTDRHCYLPHAVQGFFDNGGKRLYITRILKDSGVVKSSAFQFGRATATSPATVLLRSAPELTGSAANPPPLIVLSGTGIADNDWLRVGDGSRAEYRQADGAPVAENSLVPLHFPYNRSYAPGDSVQEYPHAYLGGVVNLQGDIASGAPSIVVVGATADVTALASGKLVEIGGANGEYRFIVDPAPVAVPTATAGKSRATLHLDSPLAVAYADTTAVQQIDISGAPAATGTVDTAYTAGDPLIFLVSPRDAGFTVATNLAITVPTGGSQQEARRVGALRLFSISNGAYENYPAATRVEQITLADDSCTQSGSAAAATTLTLSSVAGVVNGDVLLVGQAGPNQDSAIIRSIDATTNVVTLTAGLAHAHTAVPDRVVAPAPKHLTAAAANGSSFIALDSRMGLDVGSILRVTDGLNVEWVTIEAVPGRVGTPAAPDAGTVQVTPQLMHSYAAGSLALLEAAPVAGAAQSTYIVLWAAMGASQILVADGRNFALNNMLRLTTGSGDVIYHRLINDPTAPAATPAPEVLTLKDTLTLRDALLNSHPIGSVVVGRDPLFQVQALDAGAWGDRLRISVADEETGLVANTSLTQFGPATRIRLASNAGVEHGTILEVIHPITQAVVGGLLKVQLLDRTTGDITLAGAGLDAAQQAAQAALPPGTFLIMHSREFRLTVNLLRQRDPAMPTRNQTVIDSEVFRYLSMDDRHSHYIQTVIGDINGPIRPADRRPDGDSWYIRVHDLAQDLSEPTRSNTLESIRLGSETLVDVLPDGRILPAYEALEGGDDSIANLDDDTYVGQDDPTPENRTGLQTLRNINEISLVGCPGRTSVKIQSAVINHCELMRYRFAALDGPQPPRDMLTDVQNLRQQYDTKYASIYHPWLIIPDPFPTNLANVADYPIPPSGHVLGLIARIDIERGVHKPPANEVLRGITGLQRLLNKEQQDILNPYPVNINVIRDFRPNNRGIRVFGARVITSDPDWKYVNVRRLLIFIEASIDLGLQWVVFEPNAEPLWARVKRAVSAFLTTVWRNGALEGTKPEEAYFVKCDRTTMTQADIDNGRLIVVIGVAPVKPAEYVIIRIGLWTAHAED